MMKHLHLIGRRKQRFDKLSLIPVCLRHRSRRFWKTKKVRWFILWNMKMVRLVLDCVLIWCVYPGGNVLVTSILKTDADDANGTKDEFLYNYSYN